MPAHTYDQWTAGIRDVLDDLELDHANPNEALFLGAWIMSGSIFNGQDIIPKSIGVRSLYMLRALADRL
jgi:hypothetical protein